MVRMHNRLPASIVILNTGMAMHAGIMRMQAGMLRLHAGTMMLHTDDA